MRGDMDFFQLAHRDLGIYLRRFQAFMPQHETLRRAFLPLRGIQQRRSSPLWQVVLYYSTHLAVNSVGWLWAFTARILPMQEVG